MQIQSLVSIEGNEGRLFLSDVNSFQDFSGKVLGLTREYFFFILSGSKWCLTVLKFSETAEGEEDLVVIWSLMRLFKGLANSPM